MPNKYDEDFDTDEVEFDTSPAAETKSSPLAQKARVETPVSNPVAKSTIKRGWGAAQKVQESTSAFAQRFKVTEEPQIIKFLEDEPYASFRTHWIDGRAGQKSFVCLADHQDGCPLCDSGNRPSTKFAFNIAVLGDEGDTSVKSFEVGVRLIDQLKNFHTHPVQGPLSKSYWAVSKTGKGAQTQTIIQKVHDRDLTDWSMVGYTEEEMVVLHRNCYTPEIISIPNRSDLLEIAAEITDAR
jgi:hypothetical protein